MTKEKRYFAGIDIGGTNIKFGIFDSSGKIVYREQKPTMAEKGPQVLLHLITNIGERLLYHAADDDFDIKHLGVGSPGAVNTETGEVIGPCPNIEGWTGSQIKDTLQDRLNIPVFVDNDVNAMALAEYTYGAAQHKNNVICLTVGTGIGGAFIYEGKIMHGSNFTGGELGHMTINFDGPACACGNNGCLEAYCSSKYIIKRVKTLLNGNLGPVFTNLLNSNIENLTIKKLFVANKKGDKTASLVIAETASYLGIGLSGIVNLLNPETVVIGGGITDGGGRFVELVSEELKKHAFSSAVEKLQIVKASLGNDAGFIGAGLLGENR